MEFEGSQVSEPPAVRGFVHLKGKSMKAALLIIDVQKESIKTESIASQSIRKAIACINAAIILFRKNSLPIIGIQYINEEEHLVPGMDGFEIPFLLGLLERIFENNVTDFEVA